MRGFGRSPRKSGADYFRVSALRQPLPLRLARFVGVDDRNDPTRVRREFAVLAKNMRFDSLLPTKRDGYTQYTTTALAGTANGAAWFQKSNGDTFEIWSANGKIQKVVAGVPADLGSGYSTTARFDFVTYLDKIYAANGVNGWLFWDGVASAFAAVTPSASTNNLLSAAAGGVAQLTKPRYPALAQNRIYVANAADPSIVYVSDLVEGPVYFPLSHALKVNTNDGQAITGIHRFRQWMLIFKERSVHAATAAFAPTDTAFAQFPVDTLAGCASFRTIRDTEDGVFYLAHNGVRVLNNVTAVNDQFTTIRVSDPIQATFDSIPKSAFSSASAFYHERKYYLAINGMWLVYDLVNKAWATGGKAGWTIPHHVFLIRPDNGDVLMGGSGSHVYRMFDGTSDAGASIETDFKTVWFDDDAAELVKIIEEVYPYAKTTANSRTVTLQVLTDLADTGKIATFNTRSAGFLFDSGVFGTDRFGPVNETSENKLTISLQGRRFQLQTTESSTEPLTLTGFAVYRQFVGRV